MSKEIFSVETALRLCASIQLQPVHDAMKAVFDIAFAEIDHKTQLEAGEPEVSQHLRLENRV